MNSSLRYVNGKLQGQLPSENENLQNALESFGLRPPVKAAVTYLRRRDRHEHPEGTFDSAKRWYPDGSENLNTGRYRTPSRRWPFSYQLACRSLQHCCALVKCENVPLARKLAKALDATTTVEEAADAILAVYSSIQTPKTAKGAKQKSTKKQPGGHSTAGSLLHAPSSLTSNTTLNDLALSA